MVKELRVAYNKASDLLDNVVLVNSIEDNNINLKCAPCKIEDLVKEGLKSAVRNVNID